jgi:hypothetical protein
MRTAGVIIAPRISEFIGMSVMSLESPTLNSRDWQQVAEVLKRKVKGCTK